MFFTQVAALDNKPLQARTLQASQITNWDSPSLYELSRLTGLPHQDWNGGKIVPAPP